MQLRSRQMLSEDDLEEGGGRQRAVARLDSLSLLDALPAEQRAAVRGRVIDGRDYAELARELDCTELVVRQRVSRGLRTLRTLAGYTR
jgi:DNA-directed RNA polymerase specialized sigma24 family protein